MGDTGGLDAVADNVRQVAGNAGDKPLFGCFCELTATGCVGSVHGGLAIQIGLGSEDEVFRVTEQGLANHVFSLR